MKRYPIGLGLVVNMAMCIYVATAPVIWWREQIFAFLAANLAVLGCGYFRDTYWPMVREWQNSLLIGLAMTTALLAFVVFYQSLRIDQLQTLAATRQLQVLMTK